MLLLSYNTHDPDVIKDTDPLIAGVPSAFFKMAVMLVKELTVCVEGDAVTVIGAEVGGTGGVPLKIKKVCNTRPQTTTSLQWFK